MAAHNSAIRYGTYFHMTAYGGELWSQEHSRTDWRDFGVRRGQAEPAVAEQAEAVFEPLAIRRKKRRTLVDKAPR